MDLQPYWEQVCYHIWNEFEQIFHIYSLELLQENGNSRFLHAVIVICTYRLQFSFLCDVFDREGDKTASNFMKQSHNLKYHPLIPSVNHYWLLCDYKGQTEKDRCCQAYQNYCNTSGHVCTHLILFHADPKYKHHTWHSWNFLKICFNKFGPWFFRLHLTDMYMKVKADLSTDYLWICEVEFGATFGADQFGL